MTVSTQFEATEGGLALSHAILFYQSETHSLINPYAAPKAGSPTFASIHAVEHGDGTPAIGAGTPLSRTHLRQWTEALGRTEAPEILPANVLVSHPDILAWWSPAGIRSSYFALNVRPKGLRVLGERTIVPLPYPAHVFVATRRTLGIYALPVSQRPTAETPVLHSPILNVYVDGSLCWGNIAKPKAIVAAAIPDFERAVFDSWSTHPNPGQERTVSGKGGLVRLWDALAARKARTFPVHRMKPFTGGGAKGLTLGDLIKRSVKA